VIARDREQRRDCIQKELNGRETAESILAKQTERTRTQECWIHVGYFTAGNPQHYLEDAALARRCLHRSSSLQVDLCRSCKNKGSFKNHGRIFIGIIEYLENKLLKY